MQGLEVVVNRHLAKKRGDRIVGKKIYCASEKDIFTLLGLEYKEPWERNCFDSNDVMLPAVTKK